MVYLKYNYISEDKIVRIKNFSSFHLIYFIWLLYNIKYFFIHFVKKSEYKLTQNIWLDKKWRINKDIKFQLYDQLLSYLYLFIRYYFILMVNRLVHVCICMMIWNKMQVIKHFYQ